MRTVFLLFDSLNRRMLNSYGGNFLDTPNFNRLAEKSITFDNHFIGSMPCMPARRDLQSGRLSFLHRSWGPLEPFDNSFPEILRFNNIYTHLVTDHNHYFEDGGATYHNRYNSFDFIRGQERDPWKAMVDPPIERFKKMYHKSQSEFKNRESKYYFYPINSEYIKQEKDFPSVKCFSSGLEFLETNKTAKDWFLQIETFDPHEPFFAPKRFREKFKTNYVGPRLDWPQYDKVKESSDEVAELKANYLALISLCDFLLGSILDYFDQNNLWDDTTLVLTTDHGFMLGEHNWWAKNRMPLYNEISHIPLFIYHPDYKKNIGQRRSVVTQNIDLMPTFLENHKIKIPKEVQGKSLLNFLEKEEKTNYSALFGYWGGGVNITDGSHTYFNYPKYMNRADPYQYTLMPTHLRQFFTLNELKTAKMEKPFSFTKGVPVMKIQNDDRGPSIGNDDSLEKGFVDTDSALYDIKNDPGQINKIEDRDIIKKMNNLIFDKMTENDAPKEVISRFFKN